MSKNIVVLSGSPRKNGNTDRLAAAFVEGAESADMKVTLFRVADMNIAGCRGCNHCFEEKGVCVQKDDAQSILDALKDADVFVLASPIYFFSLSAQLRLAIDRTYALISVGSPAKKSALLITCGDNSERSADGAVATYKGMCSHAGRDDAGIIIATGLHEPDDIEGRPELERARALGREI
ncbi:MAG: flavodoxin family protein [Oscillospiraceae bacterium]|nr:flavodoxin family protein [Oscillospiraceae bacterium]